MHPCDKCFENYWDYEKIDNYIRATCKLCSYEVEFLMRKAKKQLTKSNDRKRNNENIHRSN